MTAIKTDLYLGDCLEVLSNFDTDSFDLIVTSPPYADRRSKTYGGISPNEYVNWFLPRSEEFLRVLKPSGTFILNIKEQAIDGERHTYVIELILEMKRQGWLWTEEFVWHKKNCYPGKWPNRFRDAWERCLQFNKTRKFNMYQESVMVPMGDWAEKRLKNLSETDQNRDTSKVGSGFGKNVSNWLDRKMAYPTNVLHLATETGNRKHSAVFPKALPEWFIKLFTKENDWVLDPFAGAGTTCQVAQTLLRNSVGIEILPQYYPQYYQLAQENIKQRSHLENQFQTQFSSIQLQQKGYISIVQPPNESYTRATLTTCARLLAANNRVIDASVDCEETVSAVARLDGDTVSTGRVSWRLIREASVGCVETDLGISVYRLYPDFRNRPINSAIYLFAMLKRRRIISNTKKNAAATNSAWANETCRSIGVPAGDAIWVGVGS